MYKWCLVAILVTTVAVSASGSSAVEKTCTDLKNAVQKTSIKFTPEIQDCKPYIVTKCCGGDGGCAPDNGFDQCYRDCAAFLEASGDEQLRKCSKSRHSLFLRRRLGRRLRRRNRSKRKSRRSKTKGRITNRKSRRRSRNPSRRRRQKPSGKLSRRRRGRHWKPSGKLGKRRSRKTGGKRNREKKNRKSRSRKTSGKRSREKRGRSGKSSDKPGGESEYNSMNSGGSQGESEYNPMNSGGSQGESEYNPMNSGGSLGESIYNLMSDDDQQQPQSYYGNQNVPPPENGYGNYVPGVGYTVPDDSELSVMQGDTTPSTEESILALAQRKVGELEDFEKFVCKSIGTMPKSEYCWMKNGNQREVGGRCKSPKDCLLYEMPLFYPTNRVHKFSDRRGKTLDSLRNAEFKEWDLDSEMIEKIKMGAFFDQATSADLYLFVATPRDSTAHFKLEIIHLTTDGFGRITSAIFTRLENKGWMVQPRICQNSGKRHCSNRGLTEQEIVTVKSTLELHAWKLIIQRLSGVAGSCNPEFNCFCYMQKHPDKFKDKASCLDGMFHYLDEGKKRGLDGSCCIEGQKKDRPDRKGDVVYGECKNYKYNGGSITSKGLAYKKQSISMRYGLGDSGRGDITPHCTGIFKCDGDLLWCPARACPMTEADRSRQGRPGLYTYSGSGSKYVGHDDDDDECDSYEGKKKKKKKKKRRFLRQIESAGEWGESYGENQRRLFSSRGRFVNEINDNFIDENDDDDMEEKPVGFLGRMLGKKKKKKKKKKGIFGGYTPGKHGQFYTKDRMTSKSSTSGNAPRNGGNTYTSKKKSCKKKKKEYGIDSGVCTSTCRCGDVNKIDEDVFKSLGNINKMRKIDAGKLYKKKRLL